MNFKNDIPTKVVSILQMKEIEKISKENYNYSENLIIENIGREGANYLESRYLKKNVYRELVFLIGGGNNGADAMSIARHLTNRGYTSRIFILFPEKEGQETFVMQLKMAKSFGVKVTNIKKVNDLLSYFMQTQDDYFVVDGILGTGLHFPLSDFVMEVINGVNKYADTIISIDIPSGVDGENGQIMGCAIMATETLCIGPSKKGHFSDEGMSHLGHLHFLKAGFPDDLLHGGDTLLLSSSLISEFLRDRSQFSHKNNFGHLLVVGGATGLTGAVVMASNAALAVGTGLVTAATWEKNFLELQARLQPEIMSGIIPESLNELKKFLQNHLQKFDAIVLGPGMGQTEKTREKVLSVLNHFAGPVLLDADALKALSIEKDHELLKRRQGGTILTPHLGEFAQFMGISVEDLKKNPLGYLKNMVDQTKSFVVLKGAISFIGAPNGQIMINNSPNNGMAKGGSGDILAGILGGGLAQFSREKSEEFHSDPEHKGLERELALGVLLHTETGKIAAIKKGVRSMTPMTLLDYMPEVFLTHQRELR